MVGLDERSKCIACLVLTVARFAEPMHDFAVQKVAGLLLAAFEKLDAIAKA